MTDGETQAGSQEQCWDILAGERGLQGGERRGCLGGKVKIPEVRAEGRWSRGKTAAA